MHFDFEKNDVLFYLYPKSLELHGGGKRMSAANKQAVSRMTGIYLKGFNSGET